MSLRTAITIFIAAGALALGAAVKDLPVKSVNGHLYHYYVTPDKETVYSICHKLGVSKDELIRHNPAVADGLKVGMVLYFPYDGDPTVETASRPASSAAVTHKVERGETIFGLAHKYGITEEQLIAQNPSIRDGLKAGQTLTIKPGAPVTERVATPAPQATETVEVEGYLVKKKETLYSIAVAHGITVAELEDANPGLVNLKAGQVISIPVKRKVEKPVNETKSSEQPVSSENPATTAPETRHDEAIEVAPAARHGASLQGKKASIAVLLPFMLNEENPSKSAQRYTEFYKGFLVAIDSLRRHSPIEVTTYDTEGSVLKVREILENPSFKGHTAIIAPDNASQLAILAEYGKNNGVEVLNSFLIRDDSYLTNPQVIQGNLPSRQMYRKAVSALMERLAYSTPVFVSVKGSAVDKSDFVLDLKNALTAKGTTFMELQADGTLTADQLKALPTDGNYTFIPTSSRQADLNKLMPGIIEWREQQPGVSVKLFGYPEWTMFRGETLENMHRLNTTVYSRFYTDYDDRRAEDIDRKFRQWYGTPMESVVPRQGLMGFDAGMFMVNHLQNGTTNYDGVQNGYRLSGVDGGGKYNDVLYFINFRPGGTIDKTTL